MSVSYRFLVLPPLQESFKCNRPLLSSLIICNERDFFKSRFLFLHSKVIVYPLYLSASSLPLPAPFLIRWFIQENIEEKINLQKSPFVWCLFLKKKTNSELAASIFFSCKKETNHVLWCVHYCTVFFLSFFFVPPIKLSPTAHVFSTHHTYSRSPLFWFPLFYFVPLLLSIL